MLDLPRLRAAYERAKSDLLAERVPGGWWVGELSSSALSTATAVSALSVVRWKVTGDRGQGTGIWNQEPSTRNQTPGTSSLDDLITRGIAWLIRHQNEDGGFGDTDLSHSNIATTYLVVAALHLAGVADDHRELLVRANAYLDRNGRLGGLRKRYGIDKTFVVPIMTNCAIAGLLDWKEIDPLPFELACVPQSLYRFVGMPVVSYAIPALVAIGQAVYFHNPPWNPVSRLLRWLSISRSLRVLRRMQPDSGGYLEATPLTSFVVMSLASIPKPRPVVAVYPPPEQGQTATTGRGFDVADAVIREGVKFLAHSIRPDGSWPIDTNLATWNTTLAINALAGAGEDVAELLTKPRPVVAVYPPPKADDELAVAAASVLPRSGGPQTATTGRGFENLLDWLLSCQHTQRHPFTGADPGGFGWSDLSGAVPDADDTPGALLALAKWNESSTVAAKEREKIYESAALGLSWLLGLQNSDRGWPTFCRGWGKLPFDRSGSDLTAHTIRAIDVWRKIAFNDNESSASRIFQGHLHFNETLLKARALGADYLVTHQNHDSSWSPLWFGNQDHPDEANPVYGTAKALFAYRDLGKSHAAEALKGVAWLVANQNADGGWGSGTWQKFQISDFRFQIEEGKTDRPVSGRSVLSTHYSVLSTDSEPATSPNPSSANLKSSVEETALAVEALLAAPSPQPLAPSPSVARGLAWLIDRVEAGQHRQPAPIGFYFAKLWYYEKLYPIIFTVAALGRAYRQFSHPAQTAAPSSPHPDRSP